MKQIISLHLSNKHLRILVLTSHAQSISIDVSQTIDLPAQPFPPHLDTLDIQAYLPQKPGHLVCTFGGGLFHIQRVPLEMASEPDRQDQIYWEASQVLIDDNSHYHIDFLPAGRVAFWTAIRTRFTQAYTDYFSQLGYENISFITEPMALQALSQAYSPPNNKGAIWLGHAWDSFVAHTTTSLTMAETIGHQNKSKTEFRNLSQIKRWIQGDLNTERRRPTFDRVLLCGEPEFFSTLSKSLSDFKTPRIDTIDFSKLPIHATTLDQQDSPAFALALGAAMAQL